MGATIPVDQYDARNITFETQVREAAEKAGIHSLALDDLMIRARDALVLDQHNRLVIAEGRGAAAWIESLRTEKAHWFDAPVPVTEPARPKGVITRAEFEAMNHSERGKAMRSGARLVDKL